MRRETAISGIYSDESYHEKQYFHEPQREEFVTRQPVTAKTCLLELMLLHV